MNIIQNPDAALVREMRVALAANDGYCPCMVEKNDDTKCMCKEFREAEAGPCHCGLYIKQGKNEMTADTTGSRKIKVFGSTRITVSVLLDIPDIGEARKTEILELAETQFKGMRHYADSSGRVKMLGVVGTDEAIEAEEPVFFDNYVIDYEGERL